MDEKRKEWCKKYEVKIADGGFIDEYCTPEHVKCILPQELGRELYFIGFDGRTKTYEQLTKEEKQDYEKQIKEIPKKLNKFVNKTKNEQEEGR